MTRAKKSGCLSFFISENLKNKQEGEKTMNEIINGFLHSKDEDGRHQPESLASATMLEKVGDNDYIVALEDGTRCHALFNWFCGAWFIDDVYGVVAKGSEQHEQDTLL